MFSHIFKTFLMVAFKNKLFMFSASVPGNYHHILVNDELEKAYTDFKSIINKVKQNAMSFYIGR